MKKRFLFLRLSAIIAMIFAFWVFIATPSFWGWSEEEKINLIRLGALAFVYACCAFVIVTVIKKKSGKSQ